MSIGQALLCIIGFVSPCPYLQSWFNPRYATLGIVHTYTHVHDVHA